MYTKKVDKIPSYRTQLETYKKSEIIQFHLIPNVWVLYQYNRIRRSRTVTPPLSNFQVRVCVLKSKLSVLSGYGIKRSSNIISILLALTSGIGL